MKICRFRLSSDTWNWGEILGDYVREMKVISHDPLVFEKGEEQHRLANVELLEPSLPTRLVGIGNNFRRKTDDSITPVIFEKPLSSLVRNGSVVNLPRTYNVWGEPEIGIIIKKSCYRLSGFNLSDYVLGYCLINDTTALSQKREHDSHTPEAKGQTGFCQIGSFINTDFDYKSAAISGSIDGKLYRYGKVTNMKWDLTKVLREVSARWELKPLDIIFTGCPERVSPEKTYLKGDEVFIVEVDGLGSLVTNYKREP